MPPLYIQELHQEQTVDFLSSVESKYFIFLGREVDSTIFPNIRFFRLRVGC